MTVLDSHTVTPEQRVALLAEVPSANEIRDRILDGRFASGAASTAGKPHITWILERFS